jgi:hypothetical protein
MLGTKTCFKVIQKVMCPDLVSANVNNFEMGGVECSGCNYFNGSQPTNLPPNV